VSQYTTLDLLSSVKVRAMLPDASTGSLSSANLLNLATEELHIALVPMILSVREKYYETYADQTITGGTASYPIPSRAIGGIVSVVQYVYNEVVAQLTPIDPSAIATTSTAAMPSGFYFENNNIILYPTPANTVGTLRIRYYQRPSRLEQTSNCAQVTSFDTVGKTVTCSGGVPSTWASGTSLDFVPQGIPYTPYGLDAASTGVSGTTVSFSSLPSALAIGDWLAPASYTPIPEVPFEFFAILAQATACKALEAIGDLQNLQIAQPKLDAYIAAALKLVTPRDQNATKKVVSNWRNW
jgi:hypothetical protein